MKIKVTFHDISIDHLPTSSTCMQELQISRHSYRHATDPFQHLLKQLKLCAEYCTTFGTA